MNFPTQIKLHQKSRTLEVVFDDGYACQLSCEYLRVYSPSADVKGHGPGQAVLQTGKRQVGINSIDSIGNYAIRLNFDDGHNTGIFSWSYLYELGQRQQNYWQQYLDRIERAGASRDAL